MSLTAYAKRRGVSKMAVSKAVASGRLKKSVVRDARGRPRIADPGLADREWKASTDLSRAPGYVRERADARAGKGGGREQLPTEPVISTDGIPSAELGMNLTEATTIEKIWKAKQAELKFRKEARELIPRVEHLKSHAKIILPAREKLLGLPVRARQALPHLSAADVRVLEGLVREVLEELSETPVA